MAINKDLYYERSTVSMKNVIENLLEQAKEEFLLCHKNYLEAESAIVPLPHINENGENVIHGSNQRIRNVSRYWEVRRDAIKDFLDRDWVEQQGVSYNMSKR